MTTNSNHPAIPAGEQDERAASAGLTDLERRAITGLIAVARAAFNVADDAEDDGAAYQVKVSRSDTEALGAALDTLDELPDDQPGYSMGPSNRAEWALRRLLAAAPAAGDFQEGQWWVQELDALAQSGSATDDQKRAVAVVHHMLRSARAAALASKAGPQSRDAEQIADLVLGHAEGLRVSSLLESGTGFGKDVEHRFQVSNGQDRYGVVIILTALSAQPGAQRTGGSKQDNTRRAIVLTAAELNAIQQRQEG